ncbi:PfkB family carbohydrate kinase [Nocardia veterana]|uniref:Carbohydrate kinase PfkB domain-containing protein n=1 Tax=Nocardia veterana TaxID=132249 RepID=A0A7X6M092_9NOCA|nr:PfkB family carbohydrate kinase [Nocardia veterana]NKY87374.1 hypothetical protein [Nocardia veterana]
MTGPLVVVGDVLLDSDVAGRADRRSPDAGVPVVDVDTRVWRPGGAGLAALLAARDTTEVVLVGGFADDDAGRRLRRLLAGRVRVAALPLRGSTVCKQRVRAVGRCVPPVGDGAQSGPVSLLRIDSGDGRVGPDPLPDGLEAVFDSASAILVADYGRGAAAHPEIREWLTLRGSDVPLVWDPHPRGPEPVPGATVVTPNRDEAAGWVSGGGDFGDRARELARRWSARAVAVTLGAEGAVLYRSDAKISVPVPIPSQLRCGAGYDVCGAGDRFAAAAATALGAGEPIAAAIRFAVDSAARFVRSGAASALAVPPVRSEHGAAEPDTGRAALLSP